MIPQLKELSEGNLHFLSEHYMSPQNYLKTYQLFNKTKDSIYEVKNFIKEKEISILLDNIDDGLVNFSNEHSVVLTINQDKVKSEFNEVLSNLESKIIEYIYNFIFEKYRIRLSQTPSLSIRINQSKPGHSNHIHKDFKYEKNETVGSPLYHMTALCYLNNNYSGGEISWPDQKYKIKPEPGSLVFFPSYLTHEVHEVFDNDRFAVLLIMGVNGVFNEK